MIKNILLGLLIASQCYAGLPPPTVKGQSDSVAKTKFQIQAPHNQVTDLGGVKALIETGNGNIVSDAGFESATSLWTASGGTTAAANSTAKGTGAKGYDWDSNSSGQTFTSSSVTIPNGYQGKNGVLSCNIKTVSGVATHTIGLWDGSTLSSTQIISESTTSFIETKINFIFPASGTAAIRITSVAANEPEIYIDDCSIKLADNIGTVSQAILVDVVTVTGCAGQWTNTSTSLSSFGTQTGCTYTSAKGAATAPATNIPAFKFSTLPAGDYKIEYEGAITSNVTGKAGYFQFSDGTNTARELSLVINGGNYIYTNGISQSISYSTAQSNVTLEIKGKVDSGGSASINGITGQQGVFKLWYFPSASQQAVSSAQADYDWTAYTPTFTGFGTVTSPECQHSRVASNLMVRCKATFGTVTATEARISLPNSLVSADTTKIPSIQIIGEGVVNSNGGIGDGVGTTYAVLAEPSVGYVTFGTRLSGVKPLDKLTGSAGFTSSTSHNFKWTIPIGWSSNQRAPTLVGSVTSNASNAERIERLTINAQCTASPCTISSQSSSWATVTRASIGSYTLVPASGVFSAVPTCSVQVIQRSAYAIIQMNPTQTNISLPFTSHDSNAGLALIDEGFMIMCMGPR